MKWLLVFTLFIACASLQPTAEVHEKGNIAEITDTVDVVTTPPVLKKIFESSPVLVSKNIALLLPFYTDSLMTDSAFLLLNSIPEKSKLAIQYYEGIQLALDSLDKLGIKINLHVFDSGYDSNHVKKILVKPEMKTMDIIIGPLNNSSLIVTARFCNENKIHLFSPLSASSPVTNNPYFILVNATLKTHCEDLMKFMYSGIKAKSAILVYHRNSPEDVYAGYFKNYFTSAGIPFRWAELTGDLDSSYFKIGKFLSHSTNNIIVIPSFDEVFVNNMTRQLYAFKDSFNITVFGMPTWSSMESLAIDYLQGINTHISASFWLKYSSPTLSYFRSEYFAKYKSKPNELTYQGYDLMFYIGSLLSKAENDFMEDIQKPVVNLPGIHYDIQPVTDETNHDSIQYFENKYVHILKYENNSLQRIK